MASSVLMKFKQMINNTIISTGGITPATSDTAGTVKPDGVTTTVNEDGIISVNKATAESLGIVKPDNSTIFIDSNGAMSAIIPEATNNVSIATADTAGIVKPDGVTTTVNEDGTMSAIIPEVIDNVSIATTETAGIVKPDGSTITIDENGTISAHLVSNRTAEYPTFTYNEVKYVVIDNKAIPYTYFVETGNMDQFDSDATAAYTSGSVTTENEEVTYPVPINTDDLMINTMVDKVYTDETTFTYNGIEQGPSIYNYNPSKMTMSGNRVATNAGTYSITFTINDGYTWDDETTDPVVIEYTINKKVVDIPTLDESVVLTYNGQKQTPTINPYDENAVNVYIPYSGCTYTEAEDITYNYVSFSLKDTNNYIWSDGTTNPKLKYYHINPVKVSKPTLIDPNNTSIPYDGYSNSFILKNWYTVSGYVNIETKFGELTAGYASGDNYTTSATEPGNYISALVPLEGRYIWEDGTSDPVEFNWSIAKAKASDIIDEFLTEKYGMSNRKIILTEDDGSYSYSGTYNDNHVMRYGDGTSLSSWDEVENKGIFFNLFDRYYNNANSKSIRIRKLAENCIITGSDSNNIKILKAKELNDYQYGGSACIFLVSASSEKYNKPRNGTYTVTIQVNSNDYYETETITYTVEADMVETYPFEDATSDQLNKMLEAAYYDQIDIGDYWAVGEAKTVHFNQVDANSSYWDTIPAFDGEMVLMQANPVVEGYDAYKPYNSNYNPKTLFIIGLKDCIPVKVKFSAVQNAAYGYYGGLYDGSSNYGTSYLSTLLTKLYDAISDSTFKKLLGSFNIPSSSSVNSGNVMKNNVYLTLFSSVEIYGKNVAPYGDSSEVDLIPRQFKYYESTSNRIKKVNGTAYGYWTRTFPKGAGGTKHIEIQNDGTGISCDNSSPNGISFFGCIIAYKPN